jgi:hypothetical protein
MTDQINGSEAPASEAAAKEGEKPEFPFVRNMIPNADGSTMVVYNFPNGHFVGTVTFRAVAIQALAPMAEDFRRVVSEIEERAAQMAKAAAAAAKPRVAVAGADTLRSLKPRPQ